MKARNKRGPRSTARARPLQPSPSGIANEAFQNDTKHRGPGRLTLWICAVVLGLFLVGDIVLRRATLAAITAIKTSEVAIDKTKVSPGARVRTEMLALDALDGRWWVIHAENFLRGQALRIRHTQLDNAPHGREVHWSSGLIWLLGATAGVLASFHSAPSADYVTQAAFWVGPLHLLLCLSLLAGLAARRFGAPSAIVFAAVFCLSPLVYQCFRAGMVDHHGLVCALAVASTLCLVAGGGGLVAPTGGKRQGGRFPALNLEKARPWFIGSGVLGGAALWVSAATFLPILVGCGLGAFAALLLRDRESTSPAPELWRSWAKAGCLSSLGFYLLEYFPADMGWRLEVNHPLYAFAWLGAGELLARTIAGLSGKPFFPTNRQSRITTALALPLVALPAVLIFFHPQKFFWVSDKFLLLLHGQFIQEFQSLPRLLAQSSRLDAFIEMGTWPVFVLAGAGFLITRRIMSRRWSSLLALALAPTLIMQFLGFWQIRWLILSAGLWALCALIVLAAYADRATERSWVFRSGFGLATILTLISLPLMTLLGLTQLKSLAAELPKSAIPAILARDVAHRLVQASPERLPVVLAGPTTSTELNFFAGIRTVGTLYWENLEGLKRAAGIFAAPDEAHASRLIAEAGVTHILVSTWDNFGTAYVELLRKAGARVPAPGETFIERLLRDNDPPDWLRPLYYPIPAGFGIKEELRLYAVLPNQTPAQARLHRGIYALDAQDYTTAEKRFSEAQALDPRNPDLPALLAETRRLRATQNPQPLPNEKPTPP